MSWWLEALIWWLWSGLCFFAGLWWACRPRDTRWKDITHE
jgi:hypothetical protein